MGTFTLDDYARWRVSSLGSLVENLERSLIGSMSGEVKGLKILDLGCGDGTYALEAASRGAEVWGLDQSEERLRAAKNRAKTLALDVVWTQGRAESLPFPEASFDRVLAVTVLCLLQDPGAALEEIARVLKPSGLLILGELNRWSFWSLRRRFKGWMNPKSPWRKVQFRTAAKWKHILFVYGFKTDRVRGAVFFPPWFPLARIFARFEQSSGHIFTFGAAFIALSAFRNHIHVGDCCLPIRSYTITRM